MITLKKLNAVQTLDDLQKLNIGNVDYDLSHRGGYLGFKDTDVANSLNVDGGLLPNKFGAYCNYLGGGMRGSIVGSNFDKRITGNKAKRLEALANACVRVYKDMEDEAALNDEDVEGDVNWDAIATNAARGAGIISAY